jgi:hypothetical protein
MRGTWTTGCLAGWTFQPTHSGPKQARIELGLLEESQPFSNPSFITFMPLTGDLPTVKKWKIITSLYSIFINKGKR